MDPYFLSKGSSSSFGFIKGFHPKNRETGGPNGDRTRVSGVRGQRPRPLDDGTAFKEIRLYFQLVILHKKILEKPPEVPVC